MNVYNHFTNCVINKYIIKKLTNHNLKVKTQKFKVDFEMWVLASSCQRYGNCTCSYQIFPIPAKSNERLTFLAQNIKNSCPPFSITAAKAHLPQSRKNVVSNKRTSVYIFHQRYFCLQFVHFKPTVTRGSVR